MPTKVTQAKAAGKPKLSKTAAEAAVKAISATSRTGLPTPDPPKRDEKIEYQMTIPRPSQETPFQVSRCNCSFCQKLGMSNYYLNDPSTQWKLLEPSSKSDLAQYPPDAKHGSKYFCRDCGCHVYQEARYPMGDQMVDLFTVNALTIDQPQEGLDLSETKIQYVDMLHDNFMAGTRDAPWPGGLP
ncbi:hypothetical protein CERZMDRAFT_93897 [Cercospora zeae-maydis SCOH1-5]|uniref:CENP-V/GFA domain-containing protein n=1 Tax=Cercospora zeae-maydis SCOH1-5 TaxID=717836 RepID=A0A6A6FTG3_9PEZI|nr:hypothetical protein CERZMDRAFT_93897 [Cercospora zeae-maydis SCOH1-5]